MLCAHQPDVRVCPGDGASGMTISSGHATAREGHGSNPILRPPTCPSAVAGGGHRARRRARMPHSWRKCSALANVLMRAIRCFQCSGSPLALVSTAFRTMSWWVWCGMWVGGWVGVHEFVRALSGEHQHQRSTRDSGRGEMQVPANHGLQDAGVGLLDRVATEELRLHTGNVLRPPMDGKHESIRDPTLRAPQANIDGSLEIPEQQGRGSEAVNVGGGALPV